jgi:phage terminase Nu1 subunit (DNA packaging protein)
MPVVATSEKDLGDVFGVSPRTITEWRRLGMPGRPGKRNRPAEFDVGEIFRWWQATIASSPTMAEPGSFADARRRREQARAEREELQLDIDRGNLAPIEPMLRLMRRAVIHAVALWEQTPDHLLALLPGRPTGEQKRRFRAAAAKHVFNVTEAIKQGLIDLRGEFEKELDTPATEPAQPQDT